MRKLLTIFLLFFIFLNAQNIKKELKDGNITTLLSQIYENNISQEYYFKDKSLFGSINSFLKEKFDKNSILTKYQTLLRYYRDKKDSKMLSSINLKRVNFIYNHFNLETRDKYYLNSLKSIASQHIDSQAIYYLALYYYNKRDYKTALSYAKKGSKSANKDTSIKSKNLVTLILSPYIGIDIENINLPNENILSKITYKNVENISIEIKKDNQTINEFNITLPKSDDYKAHSIELSLGSYDYGEYLVLVSSGVKSIKSSMVVSKISYFNRDGEILLIDRVTGEPLSKARAIFYNPRSKKNIVSINPNRDGIVPISTKLAQYNIKIENNRDTININREDLYQRRTKKKPQDKILFFTDKAIYTPNEDIEFKAILVKKFRDKRPKVLENKKIEISLYVQNKKIESKIFKSDEFGAIYGKFHIPKESAKDIVLQSNIGSKDIIIAKIDENRAVETIEKNQDNIEILIDKNLNKNSAKIVHIDTKRDIKGKIVISKIELLNRVYRKRYWIRADKSIYSKEEFQKLFPYYTYQEDIEKKDIKTIPFNTKKSKDILLKDLDNGLYNITLYTTDKNGKKIKKTKEITVFDIDQKKPPYYSYLWQITDKDSYKIGSTATIYIKSSLPHIKALFTLFRDNKILKEEWIDINGSTKRLIPITKEYRGNISYTITLVQNNRNYTQKGVIKVPWDNKLSIECISFSDKLRPNSQEHWKVKVDNQKAQMVVTMYDPLLDNIIPHSFEIENLYPIYYSKYIWKAHDFYNRPIMIKSIQKNSIAKNIILKKAPIKGLFFKPNLSTDKDGNIIIDFNTNNLLKRWKFLVFIHTKDMKTASTYKYVAVQKELIVDTQLPKFLREGDIITISNNISNKTNQDLNGSYNIEIINRENNQTIKSKNGLFKLKKNSNERIDFTFRVPALESIEYKIVAKTNKYIDRQREVIDILSAQKTSVKTNAIYLKPKEKKTIFLDRNLTTISFEFSSNPAWFGIDAFPYILNYPYQSSDEIFNKYFINTLLDKLIKISPKLGEILRFKEYKKEQKRLYEQLIKFQSKDGGWSWIDGKDLDFDTTIYILKGFGRLKEFGVDKRGTKEIKKAISFIDKRVENIYKNIEDREKDNLTLSIVEYLYTRSLYKISIPNKELHNYYLNQIKKYWRDKDIYQQTLIALILYKNLGKEEAFEIAKSLKARILNYPKYIYPNVIDIEIGVAQIELFDKIKDKESIELIKIWLLRKKENSHWGSTKATIGVIYTLLLDNSLILNKNRFVNIYFGDREYNEIIDRVKMATPKGVDYLNITFDNVDKNITKIEFKNPNDNIVWGDISWQYPKKIKKSDIFELKKEIIPSENIKVGDKLKIRLKLKVNKDMRYIILKDELASCFNIDGKERLYFLFDKLKKGEYSFEYNIVATHKGKFNSGVATIKSVYIPNIVSYSDKLEILVK